jgi:cell wall integrity and stress response component
MKFFSTFTALAVPALLWLPLVSALPSMTAVGCFSDSGDLVDQGSYTFQTIGYCQQLCVNMTMPVMALTKGSNCLCGHTAPTTGQVANGTCNTKCQGYGQQTCGGASSFWVVLTGEQADASSAPESSSSPSHTTSAAPSVITVGGQTVLVTASPTGSSSGGSSGPNKGAIAAGIIIGLLALAGIIGGVFFFLRRRKQAQAMEEQKTAQIAGYYKSPLSTPDSRLDPNIFKRQSDGSIADNQDYSRRVLRVANPS